jgi:cyclopropane fatty-acyl-phospholipid synthase-like methyltransferase
MDRLADLVRTYDEHPLRAATILERVAQELPAGTVVREAHLSSDPVSQITDQNHAGGAAFVNALGHAAAISAADTVLDVGAGLGGSARILAETFGAKVICLDVSASRCRDATILNDKVGLAGRVTVREGDFLTSDVESAGVSVVWSQASWNHFPDKQRYVDRCRAVLGSVGRIALEDTVIVRAPQDDAEAQALEKLQDDWMSYFPSAGSVAALMIDARFDVRRQDDCTPGFVAWYEGLIAAAARYRKPIAARELRGWRAAADLARRGVIGYHRFVAWR